MSADLTEFLLARIAEDEADARRIQASYEADELRVPAALVNAGAVFVPALVLRECEAKRRIVELHREELIERLDDEFPGTPYDALCVVDNDDFPCTTLRLLALPYADHPDWREEWRP